MASFLSASVHRQPFFFFCAARTWARIKIIVDPGRMVPRKAKALSIVTSLWSFLLASSEHFTWALSLFTLQKTLLRNEYLGTD